MNKRISFFIILTATIYLSGCSAGKMAMKKGNKKFKYGEYELSIDYYQKAIKSNFHSGEANFKIGEAYRLSNRIKEAAPFYEASSASNFQGEPVDYYYGLSLKANEKYEEAKKVLEKYLATAKDKEIVPLAQMEIDNLIKLNEIRAMQTFYRVKNLEDINTPAGEYSPVYLDGELYFTSNREASKIYKATGTGFSNIYKVKTRGAKVDPATIMPLGSEINSDNTNDGCVTFSPDGQTMVFAKGNTGRKKDADDIDLYIARFRRGGWSEPTLMKVNDPRAWDSTPSFSNDGRTLYFSSNRKGGEGGIDIYAATKDRRGRWSSVRNLGSTINTPNDDMFPYQGQDGAFYFASNGHPGFGGLDILKAIREEGKIKVENLGEPVNTSSDDFGIYLYTIDKGFFSSNRPDGKGDDDIYTFVNNDPDLKIVNYFLAGTTVTLDEEGNEKVLPNTTVKLFAGDDELLNEALTGRDGTFKFRVYPEEDYLLMAEKPEYFTSRALFSTVGKSIPKEELKQLETTKTFSTKIQLDQIIIDKTIVLENIYYDLDKWNIRPDAAVELDKLVTILKDNPEIKIELSSHTDSRATADYNLDLSKKRAQAAVDYIVSKGIDASRLTAKGYGESQLIISDDEINAMASEEAMERAHQRNRRTEFKVTEYNKVEEPLEEEEPAEQGEIEELKAEEIIEKPALDLEDRIDWDN